MPKIDLAAVPQRRGSGYPAPFDAPCTERVRQRLGNAGGLTDFGVNLMRLPPGNWSSQRHWHSDEDEFVYVLEGELILIEDGGETVLRAGDCAAFAKGSGNGHHMINRSGAMAVYLEVGSRAPADMTTCSDIDMKSANADGRFVHKDGTPYPSGSFREGSAMSALSQIRQIDYTVIFARDMTAMRHFYETVMEFPLLRVLSERWVEYRVGATTLALTAHGGRFHDAPPTPGALSLQLAFRVSPQAVADCAAALEAKGVALVAPLTDHPFGHRTIFFRDPDGNVLEIYAEI